jgi:hypothetical protein
MVRLSMIAGVAFLGLALLVGGGMSQDKKDKDKVKGKLPTGMSKLGLSNVQKEKILAIDVDYQTKIKALQTQIADLKVLEKGEIFKVLTKEQQEQWVKAITGDKKGPEKKIEEKKADGEKK